MSDKLILIGFGVIVLLGLCALGGLGLESENILGNPPPQYDAAPRYNNVYVPTLPPPGPCQEGLNWFQWGKLEKVCRGGQWVNP